jgi:hypothetical protein
METVKMNLLVLNKATQKLKVPKEAKRMSSEVKFKNLAHVTELRC